MNAIMKSPFAWLMKREYWEHRGGITRAPLIAAGVLVVLSVLGIIIAEVARMRAGVDLHLRMGGSDIGDTLQNALAHNAAGLGHALNGIMWTFGLVAAITLFFTTFFYLLGALYDDRRDRSILFWKSLPVSDAETVLSKVLTAIVVMPLVALMAVLAGYIVQQVIASIWFAAHGLNPFSLVWSHASPWSAWLHMLASIPVTAVWALPTVGWLLFWSAAVRSKPFLWAVAVPIIAGVVNSWVSLLGLPHVNVEFLWSMVGRALLSIVPGSWVMILPGNPVHTAAMAGHLTGIDHHLGSYGMMYGTFLTPDMWIGAVVGIALIAGAIWFRRWRSET